MSRRLELVQTGYVDYGAAAKEALQGFQVGRNFVLQEEERQKREKEREEQRASVANTVYRQNQSDLERFGTDLSTSEKTAFTGQFDEIMKLNRSIKDLIHKGGKINSTEYTALQDLMEKKMKTLGMNVGALKEVKDAMFQVVTLQKNKYEGFDDESSRLSTAYQNILKGEYIPSMDLPNKTSITQKAYTAPSVVYESYIPKISVVQQDHVVRDASKKIIRTEKKQIPAYSDLETVAYDAVNAPAVNSAGVIKSFQNFKTSNAEGVSPEFKTRYELYTMYMKEVEKPVKDIKDFTPVDYTMMELVARKYKPAPDETERFEKTRTGGKVSQSSQDAALMGQYMNDLFSGDANKAKAVMDKMKGALSTKSWKVDFSGNKIKAQKNPDEWDSEGASYNFDLTPSETNKSTAMAMINAYFSSVGSAGRKQ